ncbi:RNA polymerase II transcription initiation/nucleotide excision repair factor TFIIH, related [Eimeria tenella]|uniref:RNA polymerase II transcription initiation/nucleotide excision repair factor TFIIH, related n=1 Tax=Eimeria tenella TaxID=5802 RepID=U6L2K9_EIMTE|nr:RNA polymerase II transcription initiation/nucleotide excision repair factor TFIIH, related [Eimeria tenella]CDJ44637.1 RNA polymerase II transcription initiation/nucleotide excision repair factor TFIIH, related [Eimeria tenella]|eukprot:XP_013235385.1 RNA polymerase II transcription initiation/nucleotide excision repair factor TFIIH, related [Eimeria tenella]
MEGESLLAGALSIALCYVHRWRGGGPAAESRVLLLDISDKKGFAAQCIPLLNTAFAASKQGVAIDCCSLLPDCSTLLEQLCDVTRGRWMSFAECFSAGAAAATAAAAAAAKGPKTLRGDFALLQLLLFWFLPKPSLRPTIAAVSVHHKTNTAVCFCHHKPVDLCFVCSCCLAIYCSETSDSGKERISCDVCK